MTMHELAVVNNEPEGQQTFLFRSHLDYEAFCVDGQVPDWKLRAITYRNPITGCAYSIQQLGWIHE